MRESIRWTISSMRGCRLRPLSFLRANPSRGGVFTSYVRPHVCLSLETGRDGKAETARKAEIRGLQGKIPRLGGNSRRREYFPAWTRLRVWRCDEIRRQGFPRQLRPASGASRIGEL